MQQFQCPRCSAPLAYGVQFCQYCGNQFQWQQRTPPPPFQQQPPHYNQQWNYQWQISPHYQQQSPCYQQKQWSYQPTSKNWFQRHLNWTIILGGLLAYLITFILAFWFGFTFHDLSYETLEGAVAIIGYITTSIVTSLIVGWVLRQKNRSLWWLLMWLFVPFGGIVILCLENRSGYKTSA